MFPTLDRSGPVHITGFRSPGNLVPMVDCWSNFILLLVTFLSTVLCLLIFRYLLFSVPNLIYSNYTVQGNSQTIKTLYLAF